jgi:hypothetical protein
MIIIQHEGITIQLQHKNYKDKTVGQVLTANHLELGIPKAQKQIHVLINGEREVMLNDKCVPNNSYTVSIAHEVLG